MTYLSNDVTILSMHLSCRTNIPDYTQDLIYLQDRNHMLQYILSIHSGTHLLYSIRSRLLQHTEFSRMEKIKGSIKKYKLWFAG